jgi:hypothetical protein
MLLITTSLLENDVTMYHFTNRGTEYSIYLNDENTYGGEYYTVFSKRISLSSTNCRVMSVDEMKSGAKVFGEFLDFVKMPAIAV